LTDSSRRVAAFRPAALIGIAVLVALCLYAVESIAAPGAVFAASTAKVTACSGVNVRTSASTSGTIKATLRSGVTVTVAATVHGSSWRVACTGGSVSGATWYRISAINGRSVTSLYRVSYVYAASALFNSTSITNAPKLSPPIIRLSACPVNLRLAAGTSARVRVTLRTGVKVTVVATVRGSAWRVSCPRAVSGTSWYRISAINGRSVRSLYGVTYLYGSAGLFKAVPPAPRPPPAPSPPPGSGPNQSAMLEGIDVSHWQNTIDWPSVAAAGKKFAFIKASESTDFVDNMYATNRAAANAVGIHIGAYHFARPNATPGDAVAEADHFLATAQVAPGDLLPVLDLETAGGLNQTDLQAWVAGYLGEIKAKTAISGVIYVSPAFWVKYLADTEWFADNGYKVLWIAHWTTAAAPTLPANGWGGNGWTFWQYTSSGSVPGITGRVDLDHFNGTNLSPALIP
jgi:GH25 family lysozyme M1 (1,4-beta-N-acetylmuramidase)